MMGMRNPAVAAYYPDVIRLAPHLRACQRAYVAFKIEIQQWLKVRDGGPVTSAS